MNLQRLFCLMAILAGMHGCHRGADRGSGPGRQQTTGHDGSQPAVTSASAELPLNRIQLPEGFKITVFAEVNNARSLAKSPSGVIYAGNRNGDKVYAVQDTNADNVADKRWVVAEGLNSPNGVAFRHGDLYVAEISRILKYTNVEERLGAPGEPVVVTDDYPTETHHGWKYIAFGPDGKLYVPVGAPCNICEPEEDIFASITRLNPDGSGREIFAEGVRNTVGFTWHPDSGDLWFTDNGRDMMGDDIPECELNVAPEAGLHFGYPYCHAGSVQDPDFGGKRPCSAFVAPVQQLGAHVAPLGIKFYTGDMFPTSYRNDAFIARHGSWNRSRKIGYDVVLVNLEGNRSRGMEVFATGWLDESEQKAWGRPVDVLILDDGSMLVSDDTANVIYRISYHTP